ncbi:hypothetical protein HHI36_003629 [Cryptolaemus montrouzieri]|uniref:Nibrin n=1 Tax=Cryptolaemus montrouzieri TaxID=559131 RepID=A0ABD2PEK8_9CUCU
MFHLKGNGLTFVLYKDGQYKVGILNGDVVINGPTLIREDAEIEVKGEEVFLRYCYSEYSTKYNGKNLLKDEKIKLEDGCQITFGTVNLYFHIMRKIVTCVTGKITDEIELASIISELGGECLRNWNTSCTHLTACDIRVSLKILYAIMENIKIVTPEFWKVYLTNVKNNKPLPSMLEYLPPFREGINSKHLEYNEARKHVFIGKTFGFWDNNKLQRLEEIISNAGGGSILLEKNSSKDELLKIMDFCVVMDPEDTELEKTLSVVLEEYKNKGRRLIGTFEIALSILICSSDESCNQFVDRVNFESFGFSEEKLGSDWYYDDIPASFEDAEQTEFEMALKQEMDSLDSDLNTQIEGGTILNLLKVIAKKLEKKSDRSNSNSPKKVGKSSLRLNPYAILHRHSQLENVRLLNVSVSQENQEDKNNGKVVEEKSSRVTGRKNKSRKKIFPESVPINFSMLDHDVSTGKWVDGKEVSTESLNTPLDEEDEIWKSSFNNSVTVVVKNLEDNNREMPSTEIFGSNNFKRFQKLYIPKYRQPVLRSRVFTEK